MTVCLGIHKSLNYGQLSLNNRCDPSNRDSLLDQFHSVITGDDLVPIVIDSDTVVGALKWLKLGKSDGRSLMSDHVLRAPPLLASKLSSLFTALICHGYIAECLRDSIIQPIPKGLKDPAKSTNYYCGIALAFCLSKLLKLCILMSFPNLQLGYKKGFSTDLCTGLLNLFHLGIFIMGQRVKSSMCSIRYEQSF